MGNGVSLLTPITLSFLNEQATKMELWDVERPSAELSPHVESRKGSCARKRQHGTAGRSIQCARSLSQDLAEHREELTLEEQSFRARCISEDSGGLVQIIHQHGCCSISSSLSSSGASSIATHVRRVSQDEDTSAAEDLLIGLPEDSHNDVPSVSERGRLSPGVKRRRESTCFTSDALECLESRESLEPSEVSSPLPSSLSKKRRRMPSRNRALIAEDFDQILTQIF